jgi:CSLREA domain-containing protein
MKRLFVIAILIYTCCLITVHNAQAATFTVTKTADTNDGVCDLDCSLREAITAANNSTENDIILFSSLFNSAQTITLSGTELNIANNGSLSISGNGANLLTISANNLSRVFRVERATATITGVKISNGKILANGDGGGIFNYFGTLTINQSIISNNAAAGTGFSGTGGAIYNRGVLTVNDSTVSNNSAVSGGGGISSDSLESTTPPVTIINNSIITGNTTSGSGGGLYNYYDCTMNVSNSTINNNSAGFGGGVLSDGTTNLTDVNITNNTAQNGGGIANGSRSMMTITTSVVSQNSAENSGGGILASGNFGGRLTLNSSTISNNTALNSGGGISSHRCTLTINLSSINDNSAVNGGGIYNDGVFNTQTINNSTVRNNLASGDGGGIYNAGGTLSVINSTIHTNSGRATSTEGGGGIYNSVATLNISNSTINNNATNKQGGGVFNRGTANLSYSTISQNQAINGGGIFNFGTATVNVRSAIIGDNINNNGAAPDFAGTLTSQGYNLIENLAGTAITGTNVGNILGQDPQLLPLGNYGGITQTVALMATSPAVDAANPTNFPATDQRNVSRPEDGSLNGTVLPDIGAYERQVVTLMVTKTADTSDGTCDGDCSLREALAAANTAAVPDKGVIFDEVLFSTPQTITLTLGELLINNISGTLLINGTGANLLTISGNSQSRVFFNQGTGTIQKLTITGGFVENTLQGGAAVFNNKRLSVSHSIIKGNTARTDGGGIFNNGIGLLFINRSIIENNVSTLSGGGLINHLGGSVSIINSTISSNRAGNNGGGAWNGGGLNLVNTTVSSNRSSQNGGGIYQVNLFSSVTLTYTTIAGNTAQQSGGGIYQASDVIAKNTIIAGNISLGANSGPDFDGTLFSQGYNLIGNTTRTMFNGITIGNILNVDPRLQPIRNFGTLIKTHALRTGSPAIDAGSAVTGVTSDQRGEARPFDFPSVPNAQGGNGSDIGSFERQSNENANNIVFDFDGDGKSDVSVFRQGNWYLNLSTAGFTTVNFGLPTDRLTPADYDGDGKTDVAVYRDGNWYYLQSSDNAFRSVQFGIAGDVPVPSDYDGDGRADVAVFRQGNWYFLNSSNNQFRAVQFGISTDKAVPADYDGDGKTDVAVYRDGDWYWLRSTDNGFQAVQFGIASDKPVVGDYDGDGKSDQAVFRAGVWYLNRSTAGFTAVHFGIASDVPAAADYDGDGKTDVAVFRGGAWYMQRSQQGFSAVQFGIAGDKPIPAAFVPQ